MRVVVALAAAMALALSGCAAGLTELVVVVESDLAVPAQLDEVVVEVSGATAGAERATARLDGAGAVPLPVTLGLRPAGGASGPVSVRVAGYRAGTEFVATRVRTRFVEGRRILLRVVLRGACVGVVCEGGATCREGACTDDFVDPAGLPSFTGAIAGFDAGPGADLGVPVDAGGCTSDPLTPCELGEGFCAAGVLRCEAGNLECRPSATPLAAGTTCREARGVCDVAETCDGMSTECPRDVVTSTAVVCREAAGDCDFPERCDGASVACPADMVVGAGVECRPSAGRCDRVEACNGRSAACPVDVFAPADGTPCRPTVSGGCDAPEFCNGASAACPTDAFVALGFACSGGYCAGSSAMCLSGCTPGAPCVVPDEPCSEGTVLCGAGGVPNCVPGALRLAGVECRPARGVCDVAEVCDGGSPSCPLDEFVSAGTLCREASGTCDVGESCSGAAPDCPADAVAPATMTCRSAAGVCDRAELCDGTAKACPANAFLPVGTDCRPAGTNPCDAPETCTGASAACPLANAVRPSGYVCRAANRNGCDVAETCSGTSDKCPLDGALLDGTSCIAPVCGGRCFSGLCSGGVSCAPGFTCSMGTCLGIGPPEER